MLCLKCNSSIIKCIDSRSVNGMTRRRYECLKCRERFSTIEIHKEDHNNLKLREKFLESTLELSRKIDGELKGSGFNA